MSLIEIWKLGYSNITNSIGVIPFLILCLISATIMSTVLLKHYNKPYRKCRGCERRIEHMVINYGDDEGLCRPCFDGAIPYAIKDSVPVVKEENE